MRTFKIYGDRYELEVETTSAPDAYGYKNSLVDEKPRGKLVGYVTMDDKSVVACYKSFNPLVIVLPLLVLLGFGIYGWYWLQEEQPQDVVVAGVTIKEGIDNNVIEYNGFTVIRNGEIFINFQNGDYVCYLQIVGDGIQCEPQRVEPAQYVESLPVIYDTAEALLNAKLVITTDTSKQENDIVIEIPENNTDNSPTDGLEGYWRGEYIYGDTQSE